MGAIPSATRKAGGNLGLMQAPDESSLIAMFISILVAMWTVTFSGVLLGILGGHKECGDLVMFLEGNWDIPDSVEEPALKVEEAVIKEEQAAVTQQAAAQRSQRQL